MKQVIVTMKVKQESSASKPNANTEICFEVRAHSSTVPSSHRRISTNSSTQDFPHREPPLRIWVNTTGSTQLLSLTNTTSTLRGKAQSQTRSTSQMRDRHKAKTTITSHLRDKALSHHSNNHLFTKRDINTITSH